MVKTPADMLEFNSYISLLSTALASQIPLHHKITSNYLTQDHSQNYQFDPLLHLPGISPYFDAIGFGLEHRDPLGCNVTAASYLIRHAAIYDNDADYEKFMAPFLEKLNSSK